MAILNTEDTKEAQRTLRKKIQGLRTQCLLRELRGKNLQ